MCFYLVCSDSIPTILTDPIAIVVSYVASFGQWNIIGEMETDWVFSKYSCLTHVLFSATLSEKRLSKELIAWTFAKGVIIVPYQTYLF